MLIRILLHSLMVLIASTMAVAVAEGADLEGTYVEGTHYEVIDIPVETGLEAELPRKVGGGRRRRRRGVHLPRDGAGACRVGEGGGWGRVEAGTP